MNGTIQEAKPVSFPVAETLESANAKRIKVLEKHIREKAFNKLMSDALKWRNEIDILYFQLRDRHRSIFRVFHSSTTDRRIVKALFYKILLLQALVKNIDEANKENINCGIDEIKNFINAHYKEYSL